MLVDYHIHSQFSSDSTATLASICQQAIAAGLSEIAITDHVDYTYPWPEKGHDVGQPARYFSAIERYRRQYEGQLTIRTGIEIGLECHRMADYQELLLHPFDFVIGSLHSVRGIGASHRPFFLDKTKEEAYTAYYTAMLENIRCYDDFDVLGHLDYVKRYGPYPYEDHDYQIADQLVTEILQELIQRGKGIEVNTSGLHHPIQTTLPHPAIIRQYYQLGGRRITIGSDSHHAEHVGSHLAEAQTLLREIGFTHFSTFVQRQEIQQPL